MARKNSKKETPEVEQTQEPIMAERAVAAAMAPVAETETPTTVIEVAQPTVNIAITGRSKAFNRSYQLTNIFDHDTDAISAALITLAGETGKGHGFSRTDKGIFSPMAQRLLGGESLSNEDLARCREHNDARQPELGRLARYSKQLREIARRERDLQAQ
jgi:hypothetical protein